MSDAHQSAEQPVLPATMTGGCQCGRVRFTATIRSFDAYLCHCRMCQRASGGVSLAMTTLPRADVSWSREPERYASSPFATRPFCEACGSPLGFAYNDSDRCDLTIGTFDDPTPFRPTSHFAVETANREWIDTHALPEMRAADYDRLVARWEPLGGMPADGSRPKG